MQIRLREGVKFEDVKVEGMVVQRHRSGTIVVYPKPRYRRPVRKATDGENLMVRVGRLWAELDSAGAEAWGAYAERLNRRAGRKGKRLSGYHAFVRAVAAALREDAAATPSLVPPGVGSGARKGRDAHPTPTSPQGEGIGRAVEDRYFGEGI